MLNKMFRDSMPYPTPMDFVDVGSWYPLCRIPKCSCRTQPGDARPMGKIKARRLNCWSNLGPVISHLCLQPTADLPKTAVAARNVLKPRKQERKRTFKVVQGCSRHNTVLANNKFAGEGCLQRWPRPAGPANCLFENSWLSCYALEWMS